jgi:5'(3')-deoxyribonucleotidase
MKRLLVDMDEVIADLVPLWLSKLNKKYSLNLKIDDMYSYRILDLIHKNGRPDLTEDDIWSVLDSGRVFMILPVMKDAQKYLSILSKQGWEIVIVTNLPSQIHGSPMIIDSKIRWIAENFRGIVDPKNIVITKRKDLVNGSVLIDDAPHNINNFPGKVIIFDRPWNRSIVNRMRASNWKEVVLCINKLSQGNSCQQTLF